MRLERHEEQAEVPLQVPFPVHLYLIGVDSEGNTAVSYDLGIDLTGFGQTIQFTDVKLTLES